MKKGIILLALLIVISLPLVGCNKDEIEHNSISLVLDGEITGVSISRIKDSDSTVSDFSGTLNNKEALKIFKNIVLDATKEEGIVNMINPEFNLELTYEDGSKQEFNLWLGKDGQKSSLMKTNDTHSIYTISEEATRELTDLMK